MKACKEEVLLNKGRRRRGVRRGRLTQDYIRMQEEEEEQEAKVWERERGQPRQIKRATGHRARWREVKGDRKTCGNKGRQDKE